MAFRNTPGITVTLLDLIDRYPILTTLTQYLSTLDLLHLGLTCRASHAQILSSSSISTQLKRTALCDGRGLVRRQNFEGLYNVTSRFSYVWGNGRKIWQDEPIEVKLYATKCDEAGALPCVKCAVNVCEECRYYPREPTRDSLTRRPHLNGAWQNENVFCLCTTCDAALEKALEGQFLNSLCDCDIYKRWICSKCVRQERSETAEMYQRNAIPEHSTDGRFQDLYSRTKRMTDHQFVILFLCPCGAFVPQEMRPRCTWCERRHRPESEWGDEVDEMRQMPAAFNDPCYAPYVGDVYADCCDKPYPKLAYDGPIWTSSSRKSDLANEGNST